MTRLGFKRTRVQPKGDMKQVGYAQIEPGSLDEPKWMDTVWMPRNGGRVVFRTRFADYTGRWVLHCHVLLHEDHGMMQTVRSTDRAKDSNYSARARVASQAMSEEDVSAIYPAPSLDVMYLQNLRFIDPSPHPGQVFPGFDVIVPKLEA